MSEDEEDYQAYLAHMSTRQPVAVSNKRKQSKYEQDKQAKFDKLAAAKASKKTKSAPIEQGKRALNLEIQTASGIPVRFNLIQTRLNACCVTVSISCDESVFHEDAYNSPLGKYMHAFADQWKSYIQDPTAIGGGGGTSIAARISSVDWATDGGLLNMSCVCAGNFTAVRSVAKLMLRGIKPVRANAVPAECLTSKKKQNTGYPRHLIEQVRDTLFITVTGRNIFQSPSVAKIRDSLKLVKPSFPTLPPAQDIDTQRNETRHMLKVPSGLAGYWTMLLAKPNHPGLAFSQGVLYSDRPFVKQKLGNARINRDDATKRLLARMAAFHNKLGGSSGIRFRALASGWSPARQEAEAEGKPAKDNIIPAIREIYI